MQFNLKWKLEKGEATDSMVEDFRNLLDMMYNHQMLSLDDLNSFDSMIRELGLTDADDPAPGEE